MLYGILTVLAAMGLLGVLWTGLGWLLPRGSGAVLVWMGPPDPGILSRCRWLRSLGFLHCPLVAVTEEMPLPGTDDIEYCAPEDLLRRLQREREQFHGTGNGDPPGRHQRRGISEL